MGFKKTIKETFKNDRDITIERYKAAKTTLILISIFFFLSFYFIGAGFYSDILKQAIGFLYILLLLSLVFYIYFFIKRLLKDNIAGYFYIIIFIILLLIFGFLSLPVIIEGGFNQVLDFIKLYS